MTQKSLLGLVKLVMRMVLLKPTDNTDESEKVLVGNTILVAQPFTAMIADHSPFIIHHSSFIIMDHPSFTIHHAPSFTIHHS